MMHERTDQYGGDCDASWVQIVSRFRSNRNLDLSKASIIDSAMHSCKPVNAAPLKERKKTPLQLYIRHLLFDCLDDSSEEGTQPATNSAKEKKPVGTSVPKRDVLQQMRALPWDDCEMYVLKTLLKVCLQPLSSVHAAIVCHCTCDLQAACSWCWPGHLVVRRLGALRSGKRPSWCTLMQAAVKGHYSAIEAIASLLSQLNRYRPSLVIAVVDTLVEEMHDDLLSSDVASLQRRLAHARLFAECYNHQVLRSPLLFCVLYMIITLGVPPLRGCSLQEANTSTIPVGAAAASYRLLWLCC